MAGHIYAIKNLRTGRVYVGATQTTTTRRFRAHLNRLRLGAHYCRDLQADWSALGEDTFRFEVLAAIPNAQLLSLAEEAWMLVFEDTGATLYNSPRTRARSRAAKLAS